MTEKKDIERALADSLKSLTVKEPFEKITIKQITDGAGVIRMTFYHHFQDKYDLLEWIVQTEIVDPVLPLLTMRMYREALLYIFRHIASDGEFYRHAARITGQNSLSDISNRCIYKLLLGLFTERGIKGGHDWMTPEYIAMYYAQSMNFAVMYWINAGMPISPEEMTTIYEYIATRSMWDMLDACDETPSHDDSPYTKTRI